MNFKIYCNLNDQTVVLSKQAQMQHYITFQFELNMTFSCKKEICYIRLLFLGYENLVRKRVELIYVVSEPGKLDDLLNYSNRTFTNC